MDKLITHIGLKQDYDFEDYAMKVFMKGKRLHGSYWEHLNVRKAILFDRKNTHIFFSYSRMAGNNAIVKILNLFGMKT